MKVLHKVFKYLFSIANLPICLILFWVFSVRPFSFVFKWTGWQVVPQNVEARNGIDLAVLLLIYDILKKLIKLILKVGKPVKVTLSVRDPKDSKEDAILKYSIDQGLKKLKLYVEVNYKNQFLKNPVGLLSSKRAVELHWG